MRLTLSIGRPWIGLAFVMLSSPLRGQGNPGCPTGPALDKTIRVDATVPVPLATVYHLGDSVLQAHGYTWTAASPVSERVTAPRYAWPPGAESEPAHGGELPALVIIFSAFTAHDSTRLSVSSQVVCRIGPVDVEAADSSIENKVRVLGAVEIVTGLADALRHRGASAAP